MTLVQQALLLVLVSGLGEFLERPFLHPDEVQPLDEDAFASCELMFLVLFSLCWVTVPRTCSPRPQGWLLLSRVKQGLPSDLWAQIRWAQNLAKGVSIPRQGEAVTSAATTVV